MDLSYFLECLKRSKQLARENEAFISQEKVYQNASKKKARENLYILECERIKKQQKRLKKENSMMIQE